MLGMKNSPKRFDKKIWTFFSNLPESNGKRSEIVCPVQELPRPIPSKGTLVGTNEFNAWRDSQDTDDESFHRAISNTLAVAQIFGLLPLSNIRNPSPARLSYKFVSIRTFYTLIVIVMLSFMTITAVMHMIKTLRADTFGQHGGIAAATAGAVFYTNSLLGTTVFLWLAPRWISLQREWRIMERNLNSCKQPRPKLRWRFMVITTAIMIPAALEHILSLIQISPDSSYFAGMNETWRARLEIYANRSHAFTLSSNSKIFNDEGLSLLGKLMKNKIMIVKIILVDFTPELAIFLFFISKIATFTWNFTDLFVMLVATGLAERYKHLNQTVLAGMTSDRANLDWRSLREKYACLSTLVKRTDNDISPIILLSFSNNLYFICLQLLNGLSPTGHGLITTLYFFGSFGFLVGRTIAVTLLTARINDQSKVALPAIYNCPASCFTIETQRLQLQLTTDDVVMTGMKFFSITRNFMLAVAGAIVTYEVVLLQFNVAMNK